MRMRILQSVAGTDFSWAPGDVVELPDEEATKWCDGVRATALEEEPPAKKTAAAAKKPTEKTAERSRGGGRARGRETRG
jgi:hypothetical protein